MSDLVYPELSYKINGILFKVHYTLGSSLNEKQYCDLIEKYLIGNDIKYEREKVIPPAFEGQRKGRNIIDFLIEDKIILELKTKTLITSEEYFQIKRYLISLNLKLGILVNFRRKYFVPKRILNSLAKEKD